MPVERIESLDDPRLDVYRDLKTRNVVRDQKLFIAEGPTVVERVLQSSFQVSSVLISDRKWESFSEKLRADIPVYRLRQEIAEELIGFSFHSGVLASAVRQPPRALEDFAGTSGPTLILAGDRLVDPENVGALIRIASAFGAAGVLLGAGSADPFSRRVLRVSMGNVLFMPVIETADLPGTLSELTDRFGITACATMLDTRARQLTDFQFPERTALVFGNEFSGISPQVARISPHHVTIPMRNGTDSLNVAISAGIFSWHYRQQHP